MEIVGPRKQQSASAKSGLIDWPSIPATRSPSSCASTVGSICRCLGCLTIFTSLMVMLDGISYDLRALIRREKICRCNKVGERALYIFLGHQLSSTQHLRLSIEFQDQLEPLPMPIMSDPSTRPSRHPVSRNCVAYSAFINPSCLTTQLPSGGNPGACPSDPAHPAAMYATDLSEPALLCSWIGLRLTCV
jgi:hypothetical protein